jgi:MOSC domain-containing protein YiiM
MKHRSIDKNGPPIEISLATHQVSGHTAAMQRTTAELDALLEGILDAPKDAGPVEMIVRRPAVNQREVVEMAQLHPELGLVGDNWVERVGPDGQPHFGAQLTLMSARVAEAVAITRERWPLAGDQVYVDLDISVANLPAGTRLGMGEAVIEISEVPHTGCTKFSGRFGSDALRFANVGVGRDNRFRGVNTFIVQGGTFSVGDKVHKV